MTIGGEVYAAKTILRLRRLPLLPTEAFPALSDDDKAAGQSADSGSSSGRDSAAVSEGPVTTKGPGLLFGGQGDAT
jgi:hypothetical protein